jgi:hypothetical protein
VILLSAFISIQSMSRAAGSVITFSSLDNLLWSIVATIQYYTLPVMAIALVLLGIKLVASGDDTASKDTVKQWMIKILIGGVIIFGAATIAGLIKTAVGGA